MQSYANLSGQSNVKAYQTGNDFIVIEFASGRETFYKYTHTSAGSLAIEHMKSLATNGYGLNSYVSRNRPDYASKSSTLITL